MKRLLLTIALLCLSFTGYSQIELSKSENLSLAGDIRVKWLSAWGGDSYHDYCTEATLGMDYVKDKAWISGKIKAATSNGKDSIVRLDKAFIGYTLFEGANANIDAEVGRNKMENMFESKLQFDSYFNGVHFFYTYNIPELMTFTLHGGPHVIDASKSHYGLICEAIWSQIFQYPVTVKYSFTDWKQSKETALGDKIYKEFDERYNYAISQVTVRADYGLVSLYAAYLYNHQAKKLADGFYAGFTIGKIQKARDCQFDINYQLAKENAVPVYDFCGLTRGVQMKAICALTDSFTLEGKLSLHDAENDKLLQFSAIYTW